MQKDIDKSPAATVDDHDWLWLVVKREPALNRAEIWTGDKDKMLEVAQKTGGVLARRIDERVVIITPRGEELERAAKLSQREREVLVGIARGQANRDIAVELGISQKTIDTHRLKMMKKIAAKSNADVARFAVRCGLVEP